MSEELEGKSKRHNESEKSELKHSSIESNNDNKIATNAESLKQSSFSSDILKTISPNDPEVMNRSFQITDGDDVILDSRKRGHVGENRKDLIAYNEQNPLQGNISEDEMFSKYTDKEGVVPFGGQLSGVANESAKASAKYASITIGIEGWAAGGVADKAVLNVNISDKLQIDGVNILDGKSHRGTFPIAPLPGAPRHWKWIDATISSTNNHGTVSEAFITIHKMSSNKELSTTSKWDSVDPKHSTFPMLFKDLPQYAEAQDYWNYMTGGKVQKPGTWQENRGEPRVNENTSK